MHKITRIFSKDDEGIYLLHYVIKKEDIGKTNRDKCLHNLKKSEKLKPV